MSYEFVEAFSSVMPRIRITQILAILGILFDLLVRIVTGNFFGPNYADILAALLVGYYFGKRPRISRSDQEKKSKWVRLS